MQDESLEVDSNVLEDNRLMSKADRNIPRGISKASTYGSSAPPPQMDEVTKLLKSLSTRMKKLEVEGNPTYINPQNVDNKGNFRRSNKGT